MFCNQYDGQQTTMSIQCWASPGQPTRALYACCTVRVNARDPCTWLCTSDRPCKNAFLACWPLTLKSDIFAFTLAIILCARYPRSETRERKRSRETEDRGAGVERQRGDRERVRAVWRQAVTSATANKLRHDTLTQRLKMQNYLKKIYITAFLLSSVTPRLGGSVTHLTFEYQLSAEMKHQGKRFTLDGFQTSRQRWKNDCFVKKRFTLSRASVSETFWDRWIPREGEMFPEICEKTSFRKGKQTERNSCNECESKQSSKFFCRET